MSRFSLLSICLLLFPFSAFAEVQVEQITNQQQFEAAVKAINQGKEKNLLLMSGTYVLKEDITAKSALTMTGISATITCEGDVYVPSERVSETASHYVYKLKNKMFPFALFVDGSNQIIPVSESVDASTLVNMTEKKIEGKYEKKDGISIKIPITSNLSHLAGMKSSQSFGYFDCGWGRVAFSVTKSDKSYFYCTTLNNTNVSDFNYDMSIYKKAVRYVIYNAETKADAISYDSQFLYVPKSISYVKCVNRGADSSSSLTITCKSNASISGISFNSLGTVYFYPSQKKNATITNCSFSNTLGTALHMEKRCDVVENYAVIENCSFRDCSIYTGNVVRINSNYKGAPCVVMRNCDVCRYSNSLAMYKNCSAAVNIYGETEIVGNRIYNTPRDHVFNSRGTNLISGNEIYNSDAFNSYTYRNLSSDFGGVYCGFFTKDTQESIANTVNRITIVGNTIHGMYAYGNDARGIMIDDGRGDVSCMNNVVFDTQSYTIDSRNVSSTNSSSIRNVISGNILGGKYRLVCGKDVPDANLPVCSDNVLLGDFKSTVGDRVKVASSDMVTTDTESITYDGKLRVGKANYKKLKKHPAFGKLKQMVKK